MFMRYAVEVTTRIVFCIPLSVFPGIYVIESLPQVTVLAVSLPGFVFTQTEIVNIIENVLFMFENTEHGNAEIVAQFPFDS